MARKVTAGRNAPVGFAVAPVTWAAVQVAAEHAKMPQSDVIRACLLDRRALQRQAVPELDCVEVDGGRSNRSSVVFSPAELVQLDQLRGVMSRSRWIAMRLHAVLRHQGWVDHVTQAARQPEDHHAHH